MQSAILLRRTAVLAARPSLVAARGLAITPRRADEVAKAADAAKDSFKRGAKNTATGVAGAARAVKETLADIGTAAKEIFSDGTSEGKASAQHAKDLVKDKLSSKPKSTDPAIKSP